MTRSEIITSALKRENKPIFQFSNVVVVENNLIGVIVKTWGASITGTHRGVHYEVYVRSYNDIREYDEDDIKHFVYSKELFDEELQFYD